MSNRRLFETVAACRIYALESIVSLECRSPKSIKASLQIQILT